MASTSPAKRSRKIHATSHAHATGPWSSDAPKSLRGLSHPATDADAWKAWRKHLAGRKQPAPLESEGRKSPLLWAVPAGINLEGAQQIIQLVARLDETEKATSGVENAIHCWLSQADVAGLDFSFGIECLAWCGALGELAQRVSQATWWKLVERLLNTARREPLDDDLLAVQLISVELPLNLAATLPELAECHALAMQARHTLELLAPAWLASDGWLHGRELDCVRPLLASWTRLRAVALQLRDEACRAFLDLHLEPLVEQACRFSRTDGRQSFGPLDAAVWNRRLLKTITRSLESSELRRLTRVRFGDVDPGPRPQRGLPVPSLDCEQAGLAVLRSDWSARSPQLAIDYSGPKLVTELTLGKHVLWSGTCQPEVRVHGQQLVARGPWEQICFESDKDVEYLELEVDLAEGFVVQRHMALLRDENFLLMADAVLGPESTSIEYRQAWPLCAQTTFSAASETREGTLAVNGRALARVLPLALGEWRTGPTIGTLASEEGSLVLQQQSVGQRMFAPLVIDLDPRRLKCEPTWRQLTVAETRQAVPRDLAVGYRAQIGKAHWLIYRSLGPAAVRTVLSKNLMREFLIGRFKPDGKVDTLLEIE